MAKRARRRPGGRTTPPPSVWAGELGVPPLDGVAAALAGFERIADRSPLDVEVEVSTFLGELGAGRPAPDEDDEPGVEELLNGVVEVCLHHLDRSPPRTVPDFLWVLDAFDVPYVHWPLRERLASSPLPSRPAWAMDVGQAEVVRAHVVEHETGDGYDVALVARHRSADRDHVVACYVDRTVGGLATDLLVHHDADEYLQLSREAPGMAVTDLPLDAAVATIDAAIERTFAAGVPAAVAGGFEPLISIVEHYLGKVPGARTEDALRDPAPPGDAEVEAIVDRFLDSLEGLAHRRDRAVLVDAVGFVGAELGGDPRRWSPAVTQLVLGGWLPLAVEDEGAADRFPGVLRSFLPWVHRERGWADRHLEAALDVVRAAEAGELPGAAPDEGGRVEILEQAVAAGVDLDDEAALDAFLDRYLDDG